MTVVEVRDLNLEFEIEAPKLWLSAESLKTDSEFMSQIQCYYERRN